MTDTNPRDLIRRLADGLHDAADDVEGWGNYASSYFQEKHDLCGNVARIRAQAEEARAYLAQSEPADLNPFLLAWILFDCDGKLRPEAQKVLAARGIARPEPKVPTEEEILELSGEHFDYRGDSMGGCFIPLSIGPTIELSNQVQAFARAVLARWGK